VVVRRLSESRAVEQALVKFYSKQFGISEDDAKSILQPVLERKDVLKEITSRLPEIQSMAEAISKLPPELRQPMVDLFTRSILTREDEEDMAEITRTAKSLSKAMVIAKMMSTIISQALKEEQTNKQPEVESLKAELIKTELEKMRTEFKSEIEKLKEEIKSVKGEKRKNILVKLAKSLSKLAEALEVHERRFEEIERRLEAIQQTPVVQQPPSQQQPQSQPVPQPQAESKEAESKEDLKKKVRELIRDSTEFLQEFGFEVRKPGEASFRKEKSTIDKLIDKIADAISDKDVIKVVAEAIKETLRELRQAQGQGQPATVHSIPRLESYMSEIAGVEETPKGSGATVGSAGGEVVGGEEGPEGPRVAEGSAGDGSQ
jgi:Asp-tRNA(Asn)/Glu-tRNA(Gln) amidotransferase C subunit